MSGKLNIVRRLGTTTKNSLAVIGFCTVVYTAKEVHGSFSIFDRVTKSTKRKKKILVLPFHKMKIVEQKKPSLSNLLDKLSSGREDKVMEVEIREFVDAIHAAATDPDIVALHGTFGQGFGFQCGGYGHIEEIRNAIRVFNESHRRHYEPRRCSAEEDRDNYDQDKFYDKDMKEVEPVQKTSFAFADTFDNPSDPGNKEYFLASAFSQIHMQPRGNMQLFGVSMSNIFIADALKKYGIKVHVFKHGMYKNAPNSVTESGYTRHHYENTKAIIDSLNQSVYSMISQSRNLPSIFDSTVWKHIHNYGTMTANNCKEIHLVDHLPKVNPLMDLIKMNDSKDGDEKKEYFREKHAELIKKVPFEANKVLSLTSYFSELEQKQKRQRRKIQLYDKLNHAVKRSTAFESLLNLFNCQAPYFYFDRKEVDNLLSRGTRDKVAVVYVTGPINDKLAQRVTRALRQIKYDDRVKCIVVRVDSPGGGVTASETILEECKDTGKPIVCSFANVAASGGYYISTCAEKIFSQQTTLTGSIGVFGVKIDAVEAAKRYGIEFSSISSGHHAQTYSLFHPLNDAMKTNLKRNMNRVYEYFKKLVSDGRKIPIQHVEEVAQGRVWTGVEAKEKRLVDELGGLRKAISYASSKYASIAAEVETYPKPPTFAERFHRLRISTPEVLEALRQSAISPCSIHLCMDESNALELSLEEFHDTWGFDKDSYY